MRWTTAEIKYLDEHRCDGAASIAANLDRSVISVQVQASRYGIPLTPVYQCPKCGGQSVRPLNPATGWCLNCTKEARRDRISEQVRAMEEEARRAEREDRERQKLYSRKNRAKKRLESMKSNENGR